MQNKEIEMERLLYLKMTFSASETQPLTKLDRACLSTPDE